MSMNEQQPHEHPEPQPKPSGMTPSSVTPVERLTSQQLHPQQPVRQTVPLPAASGQPVSPQPWRQTAQPNPHADYAVPANPAQPNQSPANYMPSQDQPQPPAYAPVRQYSQTSQAYPVYPANPQQLAQPNQAIWPTEFSQPSSQSSQPVQMPQTTQPAQLAQPQPYPVQPSVSPPYPAYPQYSLPQSPLYQHYPVYGPGYPGQYPASGPRYVEPAQPQLAYPVQPQPQLQLQPQYRPQYQPTQPQKPPVIAVDPRQAWRTWRRRVVNRAMGVTFIYEALMYVGSIVAMITLGVAAPSMVAGDSTKGDGIISLASLVFAMGFLLIMRHRDILTREFWLGGPHRDTYGEPNQIGRPSQYGGGRMQPQWFLIFVLLGMGTQSAVSLVQLVLSSFGATISSPTSESLDQSATTVTMWLYIGLFGPICEEVMFRGVLMKELKPLGRNFAIVTSALAFGLFHGDFVQGMFAFLFGLILGFVAMEYSLVWSIALHIFNNAVLSGLIDTWFAGQLNDSQYEVYVIVLTAVGAIGAVVALVAYGRGLKQYRLQNRSIPDTYAGWTSPVFIVFIVANVAQAALSLAGVM